MIADLPSLVKSLKQALPDASLELCRNPGPSGQDSLLVAGCDLVAVCSLLRDQHEFDLLSNVTGIDWPDSGLAAKVAVIEAVQESEADGSAVTENQDDPAPVGFLEVVYHLYSTTKRIGPLVLRCRTKNRNDDVVVPSIVAVYRSAEFQEREVFDLFGVRFDGHPDLRRILMWDEFEDYPMRKDYEAPDDYEYEPTPHDAVMEKAKRHYSPEP